MIAGRFTSAAALLTQAVHAQDDRTHFLIWFWDWLERYLQVKVLSFGQVRQGAKQLGLALPPNSQQRPLPVHCCGYVCNAKEWSSHLD
jgi:hypothetical protein